MNRDDSRRGWWVGLSRVESGFFRILKFLRILNFPIRLFISIIKSVKMINVKQFKIENVNFGEVITVKLNNVKKGNDENCYYINLNYLTEDGNKTDLDIMTKPIKTGGIRKSLYIEDRDNIKSFNMKLIIEKTDTLYSIINDINEKCEYAITKYIAEGKLPITVNPKFSILFRDNFLFPDLLCTYKDKSDKFPPMIKTVFADKDKNILYSDDTIVTNPHTGIFRLRFYNIKIYNNRCYFNTKIFEEIVISDDTEPKRLLTIENYDEDDNDELKRLLTDT